MRFHFIVLHSKKMTNHNIPQVFRKKKCRFVTYLNEKAYFCNRLRFGK